MKRLMAGIALAVCLTVAAPSALGRVDAEAATTAPVSVQLLAINDFHGNIEPPGGTFFGQPAGGAGVPRHAHRGAEGPEPEHDRRWRR